jgi:hypothetical protein
VAPWASGSGSDAGSVARAGAHLRRCHDVGSGVQPPSEGLLAQLRERGIVENSQRDRGNVSLQRGSRSCLRYKGQCVPMPFLPVARIHFGRTKRLVTRWPPRQILEARCSRVLKFQPNRPVRYRSNASSKSISSERGGARLLALTTPLISHNAETASEDR